MDLKNRALPLFVVLSFAVGCNSSTTLCTGSDGSQTNVSEIFGAWRMVSGYSPPKTEAELALNFQVLVIEPGTRICEYEVINGNAGSAPRIFLGQYTHDVNLKTIAVQGESTSESLRYSFTGGCNDPQMTITSASGNVERYELWSKDSNQINCGE